MVQYLDNIGLPAPAKFIECPGFIFEPLLVPLYLTSEGL